MKIYSKFKDYYDGVGASDLDNIPVYERHSKEVIEGNILKQGMNGRSFTRISISNNWAKDHIESKISTGIVGFCGKIYPYIIKDRYTWDHQKIGFKVEYDQTKFPLMLYPVCDKFGQQKHQIKYLNDWLENIKRLDFIFKKYNVPSFAMVSTGIKKEWRIELNPRLADHYFFKVKDSYSAYQDILMYLGNDLATDTNVNTPVGGDKILAESKGFDKLSFRKEAGGKKRRKGK